LFTHKEGRGGNGGQGKERGKKGWYGERESISLPPLFPRKEMGKREDLLVNPYYLEGEKENKGRAALDRVDSFRCIERKK